MTDTLTGRQREVAGLVASGLTNRQVAEQLGISRDGVKYHVSEILSRLGVSSRASVREALWGPDTRPATDPSRTGATAKSPAVKGTLPATEVDFATQLLAAMRGSLLQRILRIAADTGLLDALRRLPPATAGPIARQAQIDTRYARAMLQSLTAHAVVQYRPAKQHFHLPPAQRALLTPDRPDTFLELIDSTTPRDPSDDRLIRAIQDGGGYPLEAGMPNQWANLIHILPHPAHGLAPAFEAAPSLEAALQSGITVGEAGCGQGRLLIELARAYPRSRFLGYDLNPHAVQLASAHATDQGADNCQFVEADVTQLATPHDLMLAFGMLHDTAQPEAIIAAAAAAIAPAGVFVATEITASSRLERNLGRPLIEVMYDLSLLHCVPHSVALGGAGLGALWGEEAVRAALEAGGLHVQIVRSSTDAFHSYFIATPTSGSPRT